MEQDLELDALGDGKPIESGEDGGDEIISSHHPS